MIAISYRREDSQPIAGRLYDRLQAKFGKQNVFMDFDSIPPGVDFREQIKRTIERSNLVIAVIGPHWLGEQSDGSRRIDDPTDFVRLEIEYALKRGIPVIPLLINNTQMPKADKLPVDIEQLVFRNALPLDSGIDFHGHTDRLINGIFGLVDLERIQDHRIADAEKTPSAIVATRTPLAHPPRQSKVFVWGALTFIFLVGLVLLAQFLATNYRGKIDKSEQILATQQPTPAAAEQPTQMLTIAPQPSAATTASDRASSTPGASPLIEGSQAPTMAMIATTTDSGKKLTPAGSEPTFAQSPSPPLSNASNVLAGTWEGDVYMLNIFKRSDGMIFPKTGQRMYVESVRLVINTQNQVASSTIKSISGHTQSGHFVTWTRSGPRTLSIQGNDMRLSITVHEDGTTATYKQEYTAHDTGPGENRGTLHKKN